MRPIKSTLVSIMSLLLICVAVSSLPTGEGEKQVEVKEASLVRNRLSYKELFNFDNYSKAFGKRYKSVVDRMIRMKNYLANAFKVFTSLVAYRNHASTSYLRINERSDWTREEMRRMYMPLSEPIRGATELKEELQKELEVLNATNEGVKARLKREIADGPEKGSHEEEYVTIDFSSIPIVAPENFDLSTIFPDKVFVDHRKSGCFTPVRDQGLCGSCYAFATIAMYEWLLCNQTGTLTEFSEQYMIDCGHLTGLNGCNGGSQLNTGKFVKLHGLELRKNYPYTSSDASKNSCPFDEESGSKKIGFVRLSEGDLEKLALYSDDQALEYGPLLASVAVNSFFQQYGGGIDDAIGCGSEGTHAMLVVGRGRENGKEYWIYRNSFGPNWGEQGYYRMNRFNNCTADGGRLYAARVKYLKAQTGIDHFQVIPNPDHHLHDSEKSSNQE